MKILFYLALSIFLLVILNSCYYDKLDAIYPLNAYKNPCDSTAAVTYSQSIQFIMANNCTSCHNQNYAQGGVQLDTYASVVTQANNGNLLGTVQHLNGYNQMPPGGSIPSCQIDRLVQWKADTTKF